jgi:hypothetical protein
MPDLHPRRAHRYQVATPVSYWWLAPKGPVHSGNGKTRNISQSGVLVATSECPPSGAAIQMTIRLPRLSGSGHGMKLYGEGTVVRIEDTGFGFDSEPTKVFAASVQFYPEKSEQLDPIGIEEFDTNLK